jgi:transposase
MDGLSGGEVRTNPGMIGEALDRWRGSLERVGLETGSTTPWLARGLKALGLPVVVMDARRAADALKARVMKTDVADARALAEMLRTGWYTEVFVKSEDSHRIKALLSARDQLVRNKRTFFGQIRGLLRKMPAGRAQVSPSRKSRADLERVCEAFDADGYRQVAPTTTPTVRQIITASVRKLIDRPPLALIATWAIPNA